MKATAIAPTPPVDPEVLALELANQKAQLAALEAEWNAMHDEEHAAKRAYEATPLYRAWATIDDALALKTDELHACGQRVEALERQTYGRAVPDYGPDGVMV